MYLHIAIRFEAIAIRLYLHIGWFLFTPAPEPARARCSIERNASDISCRKNKEDNFGKRERERVGETKIH